MSEAQGLACPGCGHAPHIVLDGGRQAFCGNGACHVVAWDPELSLSDLVANMGVIDWREQRPPS